MIIQNCRALSSNSEFLSVISFLLQISRPSRVEPVSDNSAFPSFASGQDIIAVPKYRPIDEFASQPLDNLIGRIISSSFDDNNTVQQTWSTTLLQQKQRAHLSWKCRANDKSKTQILSKLVIVCDESDALFEYKLVRDLIRLRNNLDSSSFSHDKKHHTASLTANRRAELAQPPHHLFLSDVQSQLEIGAKLQRLKALIKAVSNQQSHSQSHSQLNAAAAKALDNLLHLLAAEQMMLMTMTQQKQPQQCNQQQPTLLQFLSSTQRIDLQINFIYNLMFPGGAAVLTGSSAVRLPASGVQLLSYLYRCTLNLWCTPFQSAVLHLFVECFIPFLRKLFDWLFRGELLEHADGADFFITTRRPPSLEQDDAFWKSSFVLSESKQFADEDGEAGDSTDFLWLSTSVRHQILRCGKSIRLLRQLCPNNSMFSEEARKFQANLAPKSDWFAECFRSKNQIQPTNQNHQIRATCRRYARSMHRAFDQRLAARLLHHERCAERHRLRQAVLLQQNQLQIASMQRNQSEHDRVTAQQRAQLNADLRRQIESQHLASTAALTNERAEQQRLANLRRSAVGQVIGGGDEGNSNKRLWEEARQNILDEYARKFEQLDNRTLRDDAISSAKSITTSGGETQSISVQKSANDVTQQPIITEQQHHQNHHNKRSDKSNFYPVVDENREVNSKNNETPAMSTRKTKRDERGEKKAEDEEDIKTQESVHFASNDQQQCRSVIMQSQNKAAFNYKKSHRKQQDKQQQHAGSSNNSMRSITIKQILDKSLLPIINVQISLANQYIIDVLMHDYQLDAHLRVFRSFYFLEDGQFSSSLLSNLFNMTSSLLALPSSTESGGGGAAASGSDLFELSQVFNNAFASSFLRNTCLHACENEDDDDYEARNTLEILDKLSLRILHKTQSSSSPPEQHANKKAAYNPAGILHRLRLHYPIGWPLNQLVSQHQLDEQYNAVFHRLLEAKHALWSLRWTYTWLKTHVHTHTQGAPLAVRMSEEMHRRLFMIVHEMTHWIRTLDEFVSQQISQCNWMHLQGHLAVPSGRDAWSAGDSSDAKERDGTRTRKQLNVDSVIRAHSDYLQQAQEICLTRLSRRQNLHQLISDLFALCHKLRELFRLFPLRPSGRQQQQQLQRNAAKIEEMPEKEVEVDAENETEMHRQVLLLNAIKCRDRFAQRCKFLLKSLHHMAAIVSLPGNVSQTSHFVSPLESLRIQLNYNQFYLG